MTQREIKFRAWDKENQNFIYFDLSQNPIYWADKLKDFPIQQSVGLQDKNGKEIYEGDIIDVTGKNDDYIVYVEVIWDKEEARWAYQKDENNDNEMGSLFDILDSKSEVVGNIYQNEDLLTTNNK